MGAKRKTKNEKRIDIESSSSMRDATHDVMTSGGARPSDVRARGEGGREGGREEGCGVEGGSPVNCTGVRIVVEGASPVKVLEGEGRGKERRGRGEE